MIFNDTILMCISPKSENIVIDYFELKQPMLILAYTTLTIIILKINTFSICFNLKEL